MSQHAVILRSCPDDRNQAVAALLGRAFSLKDTTCATILESIPIALIDGLEADEAAAMSLALGVLSKAGAVLEITDHKDPDLPEIEWPKPPLVFKLPIKTWVANLQMPVPCPDCNTTHSLIDLLQHARHIDSDSGAYAPTEAGSGSIQATTGREPSSSREPTSRKQPPTRSSAKTFTGANLPEITPFSNPTLPTAGSGSGTQETVLDSNAGQEFTSRLDEIFPEDDAIIPDSGDITNILDRLLPDEQREADSANRPAVSTPARKPGSGGYSVFLSKINDENRRQQAVPLLAEMAQISQDEADKLSRKVIIPVARGISQQEAEALKHRFAQIKVLARVKAG